MEIRGRKVILSHDLASLYGVSARRLNEQVRRNPDRFPPDFMFQLTWEEARALRSQFATLDAAAAKAQTGASMRGRHTKYLPYAFSEHGAVMAATILNSPRAIDVSVFVVRAFVKLSRIAADQRQFALKLAELENKLAAHDRNFQAVFAAIRQLMQPPPAPKKRGIGFVTGPDDAVARDRAKSRSR